ncbi:LapA family protein [Corynebacterium pilosum]|uniref:Hypothetical membrane protein n=1 Tax=Corynebacterium pilosum TaxID=35756 RepID=A0A376CIV5_9CORY|nr:LapA family protein [Corynebacterium pilosum]STC68127.1 hypothetical membrane protein [Corynebacterium pilosum]
MTRDYNPVDQPGDNPDQYDSTGPAPTAGEPVYITEETNSTPPPAPQPQEPAHGDGKVKGSIAGGTWAALIIGALLLIVLIIFILQNQQQVEINFLSWTVQFPAGIAYLISAITGALIMALVGGWRMFELRRQVKKAAR